MLDVVFLSQKNFVSLRFNNLSSSYRKYKQLFMYLIALFSTVVNEATGDNSSAYDSSPLFSPLAAIQAKLRMPTTENGGLIVIDIPGVGLR